MVKDILYGENGPIIKDGDFVVGESNNQHIDHVLRFPAGAFRSSPNIGVFVVRFSLSRTPDLMIKEISENLKADGIQVSIIEIDNGQLIIE